MPRKRVYEYRNWQGRVFARVAFLRLFGRDWTWATTYEKERRRK
jgi:hypothetical protein